MNIEYDIDALEAFLADVIKESGASANIFEGQRPNVVSEDYKDFIVVKVLGTLKDLNTHGRCTCSVQFFAKTLSNGTKNGKKMSAMYRKICAVFPIESDDYIFIQNGNIVPLGIDQNGYTAKSIQIQTLIKSI